MALARPSTVASALGLGLGLWVGVAIGQARASEPTTAHAQAASSPTRFLFVIDTSFSMKRLSSGLPTNVFELAVSGAHGWMRSGDLIEAWTFSDQTSARQFPPEIWVTELSQPTATRLAELVRRQRFEKGGRMEVLVGDLNRAIRAVPSLTVLLITDGEAAFSGTPFDSELNAFRQRRYRELLQARRPFLFVLEGLDGNWMRWWGGVLGDRLPPPLVDRAIVAKSPPELPAGVAPATSIRHEPAAVVAPATSHKTESVPATEPAKATDPGTQAAPPLAPAPIAVVTPAPVPAPPPQSSPPPSSPISSAPALVVTLTPSPEVEPPPASKPPEQETVRPSESLPQPASQDSPPSRPAEKEPAIPLSAVPAPTAPVQPRAPLQESPLPVERGMVGATSTVAAPPPPPRVEPPPSERVAASPVAPVRTSTPSAPQRISLAATGQPPALQETGSATVSAQGGVRWLFLAIGGGLLLLGAGLLRWFLHSSRSTPQGSLISRSVEQEKKRR